MSKDSQHADSGWFCVPLPHRREPVLTCLQQVQSSSEILGPLVEKVVTSCLHEIEAVTMNVRLRHLLLCPSGVSGLANTEFLHASEVSTAWIPIWWSLVSMMPRVWDNRPLRMAVIWAKLSLQLGSLQYEIHFGPQECLHDVAKVSGGANFRPLAAIIPSALGRIS